MHCTKFRKDNIDYTVNHNGDWSGDVIISGAMDRSGRTTEEGVYIPFELMLECVGRWLSDRKIARLEDLTGVEFMHDLESKALS